MDKADHTANAKKLSFTEVKRCEMEWSMFLRENLWLLTSYYESDSIDTLQTSIEEEYESIDICLGDEDCSSLGKTTQLNQICRKGKC